MKVLIEVHYIHYDTKCLRSGNFEVNSFEYKINPEHAAAVTAIRFIKEIKRESPTMELTKVVYDSKDITEIVKHEIKRLNDELIQGSDNLPF